MPGLILSVEVEEGQPVNPGDGLIIMEAMKMENELKASARGIVKTIHVQQGDKVEMNVALITLDIR
ncbi:MAG: acetyl-CoA carboxylase biotin carboxyl carrier protein subunit [Gemmatimonadetes bacterium]|nr:MAG: acetyl-CoA carboxylase biotin carboxyl carrier protein subunit [Gemmatimonadota bacterium]